MHLRNRSTTPRQQVHEHLHLDGGDEVGSGDVDKRGLAGLVVRGQAQQQHVHGWRGGKETVGRVGRHLFRHKASLDLRGRGIVLLARHPACADNSAPESLRSWKDEEREPPWPGTCVAHLTAPQSTVERRPVQLSQHPVNEGIPRNVSPHGLRDGGMRRDVAPLGLRDTSMLSAWIRTQACREVHLHIDAGTQECPETSLPWILARTLSPRGLAAWNLGRKRARRRGSMCTPACSRAPRRLSKWTPGRSRARKRISFRTPRRKHATRRLSMWNPASARPLAFPLLICAPLRDPAGVLERSALPFRAVSHDVSGFWRTRIHQGLHTSIALPRARTRGPVLQAMSPTSAGACTSYSNGGLAEASAGPTDAEQSLAMRTRELPLRSRRAPTLPKFWPNSGCGPISPNLWPSRANWWPMLAKVGKQIASTDHTNRCETSFGGHGPKIWPMSTTRGPCWPRLGQARPNLAMFGQHLDTTLQTLAKLGQLLASTGQRWENLELPGQLFKNC